jgi:hypothetical protein
MRCFRRISKEQSQIRKHEKRDDDTRSHALRQLVVAGWGSPRFSVVSSPWLCSKKRVLSAWPGSLVNEKRSRIIKRGSATREKHLSRVASCPQRFFAYESILSPHNLRKRRYLRHSERLCIKCQADSHSAWYSRKEDVKGKGRS